MSSSDMDALMCAGARTGEDQPEQDAPSQLATMARSRSLLSPHRPFVLADECISSWTTPYSIAFRHNISSVLSDTAFSRISDTILKGLETRTKKNYGAGLLRFTQFCDLMKIPESARMPAPEPIIAAFVAHYAGTVRHDTITGWLAGLAVWHALNGAKWQGSTMVAYTKKGAKKLEPPPTPKRPPVTLEHMHALFARLTLADTFDAAVFAVACCAFWGCRCLGELVVPSRGGFEDGKHVHAGVDVGMRATPSDPTDPVTALLHHRSINRGIPSGAPLFAFETSGTAIGWAPMTHDWFLERCNQVWVQAGLAPLTGHCFRIGGATELLLRGTHPDVVAVQGGWKSRAFLEYWRKIEQILPLFISDSFNQSRAQLLTNTMDDYRRRHGC
ncbi:hypothetical protein C8Q79DRAFT_999404 [Trametes meyenii]|nr:hypothetical protein C8Q79DRAFT_999404 [Trametes meyenii]